MASLSKSSQPSRPTGPEYSTCSGWNPWTEETTDGGARKRGTREGETTGAEHLQPSNAEGQLYCAILYKGLEHPWILVSAGLGVLEPISTDTEGRLYSLDLPPPNNPSPFLLGGLA